jgi:hypothetical protein
MELKKLKPKLGGWLTIEELRDHLTRIPKELYQGIPINRKLLETASEFVEARRGSWEHADWESFLQDLNAQGFHLSEEHKASIGNILEIFKKYYHADSFHEVSKKRRKSASEKLTHS